MTETVTVGITILVVVLVLVLLASLIMKPIKLLWKVLINSGLGFIMLILFNYLSAYFSFGFTLPINVVTILIVGFLGVPGILLLLCFQFLL